MRHGCPLRTERTPRIPPRHRPSRRVQLRDDAPVINYMDPPSFPAEQYRGLAVQVEERINPLGTWGYTLTVTSPEEAAGKTLTSLNLALTLTRGQERRVLLLEGDLWRPQLHTYFLPERPDRPGLQQVLERRTSLADCVVSLEGEQPRPAARRRLGGARRPDVGPAHVRGAERGPLRL